MALSLIIGFKNCNEVWPIQRAPTVHVSTEAFKQSPSDLFWNLRYAWYAQAKFPLKSPNLSFSPFSSGQAFSFRLEVMCSLTYGKRKREINNIRDLCRWDVRRSWACWTSCSRKPCLKKTRTKNSQRRRTTRKKRTFWPVPARLPFSVRSPPPPAVVPKSLLLPSRPTPSLPRNGKPRSPNGTRQVGRRQRPSRGRAEPGSTAGIPTRLRRRDDIDVAVFSEDLAVPSTPQKLLK